MCIFIAIDKVAVKIKIVWRISFFWGTEHKEKQLLLQATMHFTTLGRLLILFTQ